MVRPCIAAFTLMLLACASRTDGAAPREITGTLVRSTTGSPVAGQPLVLDRAAGDYTRVPFAMLIFGTPQPAIIARSVTDARGRFRFVTSKDRGRRLTVRFAAPIRVGFHSRVGHTVRNLRDSLHPKKARVEFDGLIMHKPGGGFTRIP